MPNLGARLYGRLDPYTPEKVKAIYARIASECPRFSSVVISGEDAVKFAYMSYSGCKWTYFKDPFEMRKGRDAIMKKYDVKYYRFYPYYQFGTDYVSG